MSGEQYRTRIFPNIPTGVCRSTASVWQARLAHPQNEPLLKPKQQWMSIGGRWIRRPKGASNQGLARVLAELVHRQAGGARRGVQEEG
eukprot:8532318-Prorocentrum_lima.AAC.1